MYFYYDKHVQVPSYTPENLKSYSLHDHPQIEKVMASKSHLSLNQLMGLRGKHPTFSLPASGKKRLHSTALNFHSFSYANLWHHINKLFSYFLKIKLTTNCVTLSKDTEIMKVCIIDIIDVFAGDADYNSFPGETAKLEGVGSWPWNKGWKLFCKDIPNSISRCSRRTHTLWHNASLPLHPINWLIYVCLVAFFGTFRRSLLLQRKHMLSSIY